jgi:hypothetical protein
VSIDLATHDCAAQALSRLPAYMRRQRWQEFVEVIASEIQEVDDAIVATFVQLHLDQAEGARLDLIGVEVNEVRNGLEDDDYRHNIKLRIADNRSRAVAEDVLRVVRLVLDDEDKTVELRTLGVASAELTIGGAGMTTDETDRLAAYAKRAVAAGVRLTVETSSVEDVDTFRFAAGPGTQPTIDLATPTGGDFDTVVALKMFGSSSNGHITLEIAADGAAPDEGAWTDTFPDLRFIIKDGVTTIADFEAAIADQSDFLEIVTPSTLSGAFVEFDSTFPAQPFAGAEDADSEPGKRLRRHAAVPRAGAADRVGVHHDRGRAVAPVRQRQGLDDHGTALNGAVTLAFIPDAGAPNAGEFSGTSLADMLFLFKSGVTTIADFEDLIAENQNEHPVSGPRILGVRDRSPRRVFGTESLRRRDRRPVRRLRPRAGVGDHGEQARQDHRVGDGRRWLRRPAEPIVEPSGGKTPASAGCPTSGRGRSTSTGSCTRWGSGPSTSPTALSPVTTRSPATSPWAPGSTSASRAPAATSTAT